MNHLHDLDAVRRELQTRFPSGRIGIRELGETLAHLVWESFSDFLADRRHASARELLGIDSDGVDPADRAIEELLIFHMWAHSRAVQLSFVERLSRDTIREVLDELHRAVFDDMVANGTPRVQVPIFEQRVSARYVEYYAAANRSDRELGRAVLAHVADGAPGLPNAGADLLRERAVELARPLRDYLEGIDVRSSGPTDALRAPGTTG